MNDSPSVRTIYLKSGKRKASKTQNSRYGKGSVVAVLIVADCRKCLKSRLFRAKVKGR